MCVLLLFAGFDFSPNTFIMYQFTLRKRGDEKGRKGEREGDEKMKLR